MVGLRRQNLHLENADSEKLYDLLHRALIEDWPYAHVKAALIALAQTGNTPDDHYGKSDFDTLWKKAEGGFAVAKTNGSADKFRRYVTGQILREYPDHAGDVLEKIAARLAE